MVREITLTTKIINTIIMAAKRLNIVVAACKNQGIGIEGRIPWRLKKDMMMFKRITSTTDDKNKQNVVIMGRKTWMSIPEKFRPLPNRVNIVLSTAMNDVPSGVHLARSFQKAIDLISSPELSNIVESVFIIGGSSVYRAALDNPNCRLYFTRVLSEFECDTFFPEISLETFTKVDNPDWLPNTPQTEGDIEFVYEVYDKVYSE